MLNVPLNSIAPIPQIFDGHVNTSEQVDGEYIETEVMCAVDYGKKKYSTEMKGLLLESKKGNILKPLMFEKIKIGELCPILPFLLFWNFSE